MKLAHQILLFNTRLSVGDGDVEVPADLWRGFVTAASLEEPSMADVLKTPCITCGKPLMRQDARHKCPHGVWCIYPGRPQLASRSRTCSLCNAVKTAQLPTR